MKIHSFQSVLVDQFHCGYIDVGDKGMLALDVGDKK